MLISLQNISLKVRNQEIGRMLLKDYVLSLMSKKGNAIDDRYVFKNISFDINVGDRIALIGKNGAGKSSILRVIAGVFEPSTGVANINCSIAALIEIGTGFKPDYSGRQNIILTSLFFGIDPKNISTIITDIINFSDLGEHIDIPVKYYSTGMQLRLSFAIAIHIDADLLILDEMFAGGDQSFKYKAKTALDNKIHNSKALIFSSHDEGLIRNYSNKAILIHKGDLLFFGNTIEALKEYHKLK